MEINTSIPHARERKASALRYSILVPQEINLCPFAIRITSGNYCDSFWPIIGMRPIGPLYYCKKVGGPNIDGKLHSLDSRFLRLVEYSK